MNLFFPSNNALANTLYGNTLNRISELPGMRRYYVADRNRDKVRALLTWDATTRLSIQAGADFNRDDYPASVYGLQNAKSWAASLDGTYALTDVVSANAFYTYDNSDLISAGNTYTANSNASTLNNSQPGAIFLSGNACDGYTTLQQRNNNNKLDPCLDWSSNRLDNVHTVGFGLRAKTDRIDLNASRDRHARARGQQRPRRQLGQQHPQRSRRAADDHRRLLHSRRAAADRHDQYRRSAREWPVHDHEGAVAPGGLHLPAHEQRRLDVRRHAVRIAQRPTADQRTAVQVQGEHDRRVVHRRRSSGSRGDAFWTTESGDEAVGRAHRAGGRGGRRQGLRLAAGAPADSCGGDARAGHGHRPRPRGVRPLRLHAVPRAEGKGGIANPNALRGGKVPAILDLADAYTAVGSGATGPHGPARRGPRGTQRRRAALSHAGLGRSADRSASERPGSVPDEPGLEGAKKKGWS